MNSQMKRCIRQGMEGSQVQELLSLWSRHGAPSWCGCVHQTGSSLSPVVLGFYRGLFSQENGGGAEVSKLLIMPSVSGEPPSSRKRYSYYPGNYLGFRSPVSGTRVKDQILEQKVFLVTCHLGSYKVFSSSVP